MFFEKSEKKIHETSGPDCATSVDREREGNCIHSKASDVAGLAILAKKIGRKFGLKMA